MGEQFMNALDTANNIGGEDYECISLTYSLIANDFTAHYTHIEKGTSWLLVRDAPNQVLRDELKQHHKD